ncbi:MAG: AAA family ATPase [Bacteroidota bacterium]
MKPYTKKYIITGAPGTGKTSLINALEKKYPCIHEVSRKVIISEQEKRGRGMPWQDVNRFTELVYEASIAELNANPQAVFTDRSILDLIAYLRLEGKTIPQQLGTFPYLTKFNQKVFFTPTWESIYRKDAQRLQDFEYCIALEKALYSLYRERGFKLVKLPKDTVGKRICLIYEKMNQT